MSADWPSGVQNNTAYRGTVSEWWRERAQAMVRKPRRPLERKGGKNRIRGLEKAKRQKAGLFAEMRRKISFPKGKRKNRARRKVCRRGAR